MVVTNNIRSVQKYSVISMGVSTHSDTRREWSSPKGRQG